MYCQVLFSFKIVSDINCIDFYLQSYLTSTKLTIYKNVFCLCVLKIISNLIIKKVSAPFNIEFTPTSKKSTFFMKGSLLNQKSHCYWLHLRR